MRKFGGNTGRVLNHLQKHGSITSMEAFKKYGATRLSAIIFNLRHYGFKIESEDVCMKNRFGEKTVFSKYIYEGQEDV